MSQLQSELSHTSGSAKRTKVKLTSRRLSAAPWVDFTMDADFPDAGGEQVGDKLKFNKDAGAFELEFELHDDAKLDLAFYLNPAEAIWATVGTAKPTQPGFADGALTPISVTDKRLVVMNDNSVAQSINFILRFKGIENSGCPPYILDPIILNGGGGNNVR